jgi:4'-phosphopantetheinyl transferase EntD
MHPLRSVGIDVERVAEKLVRIAPKFLSESEKQHGQTDLKRLCTYWCAKEALYKLHGTRQLSFKDEINIHAFDDADEMLRGEICQKNKPSQPFNLYRFWIEDFCGVVAC